MADWRKFTDRVHNLDDKINFIDPNDLCVSKDGQRIYNDIKDYNDVIRYTWAPEDYCIDVDICMEVSSRGDYATSVNDIYLLNWDGKSGHISMQSGQRFYEGKNRKVDNWALQQNMAVGGSSDRRFVNYMSTRDYDVNYQDIMTDYVSTEMLGIESINISYNNNFCPEVKIEMNDVKGVGVLSSLERSHTRADLKSGVSGFDRNDIAGSFYRALFNLPYPKVTMKVKGFYGAPTTYDLTFKSIGNKFDSKTGSYKISLVLIGYYYSFLTQVPVMHALVSPYFNLFGSSYWKDVICKKPEYSLDGDKPITWIELVKRVSNAKIQIEKNKQTGVGAAGKAVLTTVLIARIGKAEDLLVEFYKAYATDIHTIVETHPKLQGQNSVWSYIDVPDERIRGFAYATSDAISPAELSLQCCLDKTGYFAEIPDESLLCKTAYENLKNCLAEIQKCLDQLQGYSNFNLNIEDLYKTCDKNEKFEFDWGNLFDDSPTYRLVKEGNLSTKEDAVCSKKTFISLCSEHNGDKRSLLHTLNLMLNLAKASAIELDSAERAEYTKILNDSIGFTPTLRNVMKLIIEHCECYFHTLYSLGRFIGTDQLDGHRDAGKLGLKQEESDFRRSDVPPFPEVTEIQDGRRVKSWTGALPTGPSFLETAYVNSLLRAVTNCIEDIESASKGGISSDDDYNVREDLNSKQSSENLPVRQMFVPLSFSDLMTGGEAFQPIGQESFDDFVKEGNMSAILTVIMLRLQQFLYADNESSNKLNSQSFSNIGTADAYNFFSQFYKYIDSQFTQKLKTVLNKSDYIAQMMKLLCGDGYKDFDANEGSLSTYYQNTVGYTGDSLLNGEKICIPSNSVNNSNDIDFAVTKNKAEISRYDNLPIRALLCMYDSTDEDFPLDKVSRDVDYTTFSNYVMIDKTGRSVQRMGDTANDFDKRFSKYGITSSDLQFNKIYTDIYEEDTDDFPVVPVCCNLGSTGNDNIQTGESELSEDCFITIPNPNDEIAGANAFGSSYYLAMLGRPVYERAMFFMANPKFESGFKIGQTEFVIDNVQFLNALVKLESGRAKVSNTMLLSMGAICWAHFFNNDVLYTLDWSYAYALKKASIVDEDLVATEMEDWEGVSSLRTVIKAPVCAYDRVAYTLALYFDKWVNETFSAIEANVANNYKEMYAIRNKAELEKYVRKVVNKEVVIGGLEVECDGFSFELSQNAMAKLTESVCPTVSFYCYLPKNDNAYTNTDRDNYLKAFFAQLLKQCEKEDERLKKAGNKTSKVIQVDEANVPKDPKVSVYMATKRLWDTWLCGARQREADSFVIKNWLNVDFFNKRFHFIDTFYNDIGDDVIINASILSDVFLSSCGQQQGWSLLTFISSILAKSQIAFYNIQNWANLGDKDTMAKAFVPMSYYESRNLDDVNSRLDNSATNSDFVCIYRYEPAHLVGCSNDSDKNDFVGDGFMIDVNDTLRDLPPALGYNTKGQWRVPAFAVTYGKQYQSYFTDIQVDTRQGIMTEWGAIATMRLAKLGSDKISDNTQYMGQDLYTIQSNQSFIVKVQMLGCCWVQPLMYFVLTNVPMYRGTYIVSKVQHSIQAGKMTTSFEGYKMSRFANRIVDSSMYANIPDGYNNSDGFTAENKVADISNDCAYRVFPIKVKNNESVLYCNTINVERLKEFKPEYLNGGSMWDWITNKVYNENHSDELSAKLVAMSMINQFVFAYKKQNYVDNRDYWKNIVKNVFAYDGGTSYQSSDDVNKWCEEVFNNPLGAFNGLSLNIPAGQVTPYTREAGTNRLIVDTTHSKMECGYIPCHYRSTSDDDGGEFTAWGNYRFEQGSGYSIKSKKVGTFSTQQPALDSKTLRSVFQYRPAGCYMYDVTVDNNKSKGGAPMGSMDTGWDWNFVCVHGTDLKAVHVFLESDLCKPVWEEYELDKFKKDSKTETANIETVSSDDAVNAFFEAIQQSVNKTLAFKGFTLKKVATSDGSLLLTMAKEKTSASNSSTVATTELEETSQHNDTLFDMLVKGKEDNIAKGYFGYFTRISWVTQSASRSCPNYILVEPSLTETQPKIFMYITQDKSITSLNKKSVEKMYNTNFYDKSKNDDCLSSMNFSIWQIMRKNMEPDEDYSKNKVAIAFSSMFGGTDNYKEIWGDVKTNHKISYFLNKAKVADCKEVVKKNEYIEDLFDSNFNLEAQDFFADTAPVGMNYQERTIYASMEHKLQIGSYLPDTLKQFGMVGNMTYLTSHWAYCRHRNGYKLSSSAPHRGMDFGGYTYKGKKKFPSLLYASYDGKVIGHFRHDNGYGWIVLIAYNVQVEVVRNGKKENRVLVVGYAHIDSEPNTNDTVSSCKLQIGQIVHKGDFIARSGTFGGHGKPTYAPHLHAFFLLIDSKRFESANVKQLCLEMNNVNGGTKVSSHGSGPFFSNFVFNEYVNVDFWDYADFIGIRDGVDEDDISHESKKHNSSKYYPPRAKTDKWCDKKFSG